MVDKTQQQTPRERAPDSLPTTQVPEPSPIGTGYLGQVSIATIQTSMEELKIEPPTYEQLVDALKEEKTKTKKLESHLMSYSAHIDSFSAELEKFNAQLTKEIYDMKCRIKFLED